MKKALILSTALLMALPFAAQAQTTSTQSVKTAHATKAATTHSKKHKVSHTRRHHTTKKTTTQAAAK